LLALSDGSEEAVEKGVVIDPIEWEDKLDSIDGKDSDCFTLPRDKIGRCSFPRPNDVRDKFSKSNTGRDEFPTANAGRDKFSFVNDNRAALPGANGD